MPLLAYGLATRTHGVRPSEKIAFRAIPGFLPRGHVTLDRLSRRGGLRTPSNEASLAPRDRPIGPPGVHLPPMIMLSPGLLSTRVRGRGDRAPPRNTPFALSTAFPRKASSPRSAPRGGAGSARPQGRRGVDRGMCPVGQPASCLMIGWKWNASARVRPCNADARSASLRENRLSRHPRVSPARPRHFGSPLPEGRAPHARGKGIGSTRAYPRQGAGPSLTDVVGMRCLGLRAASQRGRTECVPPRKPPFASSPNLPP
jgi:hypothetical protein